VGGREGVMDIDRFCTIRRDFGRLATTGRSLEEKILYMDLIVKWCSD
jgi:hypothetical protein